jgi:hypothetical protein
VFQIGFGRNVCAGQNDQALEILLAARPGEGGIGEDSGSEEILLDRT